MIRYIILTLLCCTFLHAHHRGIDEFPTQSVSRVLRQPGTTHHTLTEPQQRKLLELVQETVAKITFLDADTLDTPIRLNTCDIENIACTFRDLQLEMDTVSINESKPQFNTKLINQYHGILFNSHSAKDNPAPIATFVADTLFLTYSYATLEDYLSRARLHQHFMQKMNYHLGDTRTVFLWFSLLDTHFDTQDDRSQQLIAAVCDFYKHAGASFMQKEALIEGLRYMGPTALWPEENQHHPSVSQQMQALISEAGPLAGRSLPALKTSGLRKTGEGDTNVSTASDLVDFYVQTFQSLTSP